MRPGVYGLLGLRQSHRAMTNHQVNKDPKSARLAFIGGTKRLMDLGGKETLGYLSLSGAFSLRSLFRADIVITIRWWDPIVIWIKLLRPGVTTIFVADGHFSLLGLNSRLNRRAAKNIFEYDYCDVYLLPDRVGLEAAERYPGAKLLYRPDYWAEPGLRLQRHSQKALRDLVFVYGNDPYFCEDSRSRLLKLVNDIVAEYGGLYRISHLVPDNSLGRDVINGLHSKNNVYVGMEAINPELSASSAFLCTPSTMVWRLLSSGAAVALLDVYSEDMCFHSSIPRVAEVGDCESVFLQMDGDRKSARQLHSGILGGEPLFGVIKRVIAERQPQQSEGRRWWHRSRICTLRDYMSSIRSILSGR